MVDRTVLNTDCFVVSWSAHVRLAARHWSQLFVEVLDNGCIDVCFVEEIGVVVVPVVGISEVAGMENEVILIDSIRDRTNSRMLENWLDFGNLTLVMGGIAILAVHAQVYNNRGVERSHISSGMALLK